MYRTFLKRFWIFRGGTTNILCICEVLLFVLTTAFLRLRKFTNVLYSLSSSPEVKEKPEVRLDSADARSIEILST